MIHKPKLHILRPFKMLEESTISDEKMFWSWESKKTETYCTVGMTVSYWTPCPSSEHSGLQDPGWNWKGKTLIHQIYHLTWMYLSHKVHIACTLCPPMLWAADKHKDQTHITQRGEISSEPNRCARFLPDHCWTRLRQAKCQRIHSLRKSTRKIPEVTCQDSCPTNLYRRPCSRHLASISSPLLDTWNTHLV